MQQQAQDTQTSPTSGGLLITAETVVATVMREVEIFGLDEALSRFKMVDSVFGDQPGWAETRRAVYDFFIEQRKLQAAQRQQPTINDNRHISMSGENATYNETFQGA